MKNIFKFMGLALIAGSMMFVACSKDDKDSTDKVAAISITYQGHTWTADTVYAAIAEGMINASIYTGATDDEPLFTFKSGIENGQMYPFAGTGYYARYFEKASDANPTAISNQTGVVQIKNIDVTANTISAMVSTEMGEVGSGDMLMINITDAYLKNVSK